MRRALLCWLFLGAILPGTARGFEEEPQSAAVRRGVSYLSQTGTEWITQNGCVSCHHGPMLLWTHHLAERQGIPVNNEAIERIRQSALDEYLSHDTFQPTGQDRDFFQQPLSAGAVFLTLALKQEESSGERTREGARRFVDQMLATQDADGSWTMTKTQPPLIDQSDVMTAWIVLALQPIEASDEQRRDACGRALNWLLNTPVRRETQPLATRVLVAEALGQSEPLARFCEQLKALQNDSGGWSQTPDRAPDALATGQALYALKRADRGVDVGTIRHGETFLIGAQQANGSWQVKSRNPKAHDDVISYVGTGWAVLGLLDAAPWHQ